MKYLILSPLTKSVVRPCKHVEPVIVLRVLAPADTTRRKFSMAFKELAIFKVPTESQAGIDGRIALRVLLDQSQQRTALSSSSCLELASE